MNHAIGCPYKGLASFEDTDRDVRFFFGREPEREIICANLMASKLTVLYGDTGVGKSSVLRAGVARTLRSQGDAHTVVVFDAWKDNPGAGLIDALATSSGVPPRTSLADTLEACAAKLAGDVYVVLDGVEEYFLYHEDEEGLGTFYSEFPEAVARAGLRVSFLIAIREDALARLDRFKSKIPNLFGNYLRLPHLDRTSARSAIVGPIEEYNRLVEPANQVEIEPELVDAVLDQVTTGRVDLGQAGRGAVADRQERDDRIEAPYLQLVMRRLWKAEEEAGSNVLRASTLATLGGAEEIVRAHLQRALDSLSDSEKDSASAVFNHLVTPSGTKIAHADSDLARYAGVDEAELQPILSALTEARILRPVASDGRPRHEIYHDVLGEAILAWRSGHEGARELRVAHRRQRRLLGVIGAGAVLLAAMVGVTIFAFDQRGEARTQARQAQARQLDASAVSLLGHDPSLGLALGVEAARLEPSVQTEDVLRSAYLAARERAVLPAGGPVAAARFSPDGSLVVAAGQDGKARIYRASTRRRLLALDHGAPIHDVEFDGDGRRLITAGEDGVAKLWDAKSGEELRSFRHGAPVWNATLDPAGTLVATVGGRDVKLWRADGGRVATLPWTKPVTSASFNRDGQRLVVIGNDSVARVYDTADGRRVAELDQGGKVASAAFSHASSLLVTTGENDTARIWRLRDGTLLHELAGHSKTVLDAAFAPGARNLATVSADGTGRIWEVRSGELVATISGHTGIVDSVAFSPDGNFVVTGSEDRTARVSKADNGDVRAVLAGHLDSVNGVAFSPDGSAVLTASDDATARLWDPRTQPQLEPVAGARGPLAEAEYAARDGTVVVAGPGNRVRVIDGDTGRRQQSLTVRGKARAVAVSTDGELIAVAGGPGLTIFGPGDVRREELDLPGAAAVAIAPDGSVVAGGGEDGVVRIWSRDGTLLHELRGHEDSVTDVAFSGDGRLLASSSWDETARLWDVETGELVQTLSGHRDEVASVAFSPSGGSVLTASRDHSARLWGTETGEPLRVLRWHSGRVADANFSPDGRWIVTAGPATIGLWRTGASQPALPYGFGGHRGLLTSAVFDPTSRFVLSASADGSVRRAECVVCTDLDALLERAEAQLAASGRKLTAEERERYGLD